MTVGKPLIHADDRIGAPRMRPKELFRCAKTATWLFIRRNRLKGGRRSQADCISGEFQSGSTNWEDPHGKFQFEWEAYQMKPEIKSNIQAAIWGAVGGAIVAIVIGFAWGGWTTAETTKEMTDEALLASRAAICVAQFMKEPNHQEKLDELKKTKSWERYKAIEEGGWDKMPGQENAIYNVSRACVDGLEVLMEK